MIRNFFTLALRNLRKRKVYSFINIFGLATGIAVCLVILQYVDFELSYDKFHTGANNLFRVTSTYFQNGEDRGTGVISGYAQGPSLLADVPEIKDYIRTHPMYGGAVLTYERENGDPSVFREADIQYVDSTFLDYFTYEAKQGDLATALDNPNSVVITTEIARKYFGDEDPLGKVLHVSGGWADGDYSVTAVINDVPQNTHFPFDILFPIHNLLQNGQYRNDNGWGWNNFVTYVATHPHTNIKDVEAKMPAFIEKYRGDELRENGGKVVIHFQAVPDIHVTPGLEYDSSPTISKSTIYFFILIAAFILCIAWINYINLSTARAMERAREVGIKKAVGAFKSQLIFQFIFESVLVNFMGILVALLMASALLPVLGEIVDRELAFNYGDYRFWLILALLFVAGSLLSGAYPAFVLSSFKTVEVVKGKAESASGNFSLRKVLVVFQFAASLILIAGTFAIYRQVIHMRDRDKGLRMDQMLIVDGPKVMANEGARERLISFKNELARVSGVVSVTTSGAIPGGGYNWGTGIRKDGSSSTEDKTGSIVWIDPDFVPTYEISLLAGRNFNIEIKSDMESVLVNEAALTAFGLGKPEDAINERLILGGGDTVAILGVLKNYNWNSLKSEHSPWLFKADTISHRHFSIHVSSTNMSASLREIEEKYKEAFAGNPFDFYFLDDFFDTQYKSEQQFAKVFGLFAILAILIACLGLWGLAAFTTALKLKEIGIRKVLGASAGNILSLLSWQFLQLVIIASVVAIPLTWYGIDQWLDNFAFRIGLEWDLFVVPVFILGFIALATVSAQIFRGARTNPATILRSE